MTRSSRGLVSHAAELKEPQSNAKGPKADKAQLSAEQPDLALRTARDAS